VWAHGSVRAGRTSLLPGVMEKSVGQVRATGVGQDFRQCSLVHRTAFV
jgi:hypothetical protein